MPFGLGALNTRSAIETWSHTMENRVADYGDLAGHDETIDRFIESQSIKRLGTDFTEAAFLLRCSIETFHLAQKSACQPKPTRR